MTVGLGGLAVDDFRPKSRETDPGTRHASALEGLSSRAGRSGHSKRFRPAPSPLYRKSLRLPAWELLELGQSEFANGAHRPRGRPAGKIAEPKSDSLER